MQNHLRREHLMMKEEFPCDECSKTFACRSGLIEHKKVIHREQKLKCEYCDKTFGSRVVIANHIRIVHHNFRVTCDICDKAYTTAAKLKEHVMIKHENGNGLKKHKCSECSYETPHNYLLKQHVKTVHERREEDKKFRSGMRLVEIFGNPPKWTNIPKW